MMTSEDRQHQITLLLITAIVLWVWLEFAFQRRLLNDLAGIVYRLEDRITHKFSDLREGAINA